jgi:tetratricopeptide (TPR) repeat protein
MTTKCTGITRILAVSAVITASIAYGSSVSADDQKADVQKLFQSGAYEQAVEAARDGDPGSTYVAAQSLIKLDRPDQARAEMTRLRASDQPSWRLIGESGDALLANDAGRAVDLARRAIEADGNNPFGQYQLGLAASKAGDFGTAVTAFTRASQLKPDFAYAHYYAALAHQRQRQLSRAAEHFDAFLRLAPDAPERSAVVAILRTLK